MKDSTGYASLERQTNYGTVKMTIPVSLPATQEEGIKRLQAMVGKISDAIDSIPFSSGNKTTPPTGRSESRSSEERTDTPAAKTRRRASTTPRSQEDPGDVQTKPKSRASDERSSGRTRRTKEAASSDAGESTQATSSRASSKRGEGRSPRRRPQRTPKKESPQVDSKVVDLWTTDDICRAPAGALQISIGRGQAVEYPR